MTWRDASIVAAAGTRMAAAPAVSAPTRALRRTPRGPLAAGAAARVAEVADGLISILPSRRLPRAAGVAVRVVAAVGVN